MLMNLLMWAGPSDRAGRSLPVIYSLFIIAGGVGGGVCVGERVVDVGGIGGHAVQRRCQVLFDFNMKAERGRGTPAMMLVPSAGPLPGPPGPRRPSRRSTPEPLGKYRSYCFHCQAISGT